MCYYAKSSWFKGNYINLNPPKTKDQRCLILTAFSTEVKLTCVVPFLKCFSEQGASCLPSKHSPFSSVNPSSQESQSSNCGPPQVRQVRWQVSQSWLPLSTKNPSLQWSTHSPSGHTNTSHSFLCVSFMALFFQWKLFHHSRHFFVLVINICVQCIHFFKGDNLGYLPNYIILSQNQMQITLSLERF